MMATRHYTREELTHLRDSPLVQKPENLPAIEQWIEYVFADKESREKLRIPHSEPQQATKRQPPSKSGAAGEASPMGNFSTGLRPSLMGARGAGRGGDDISLGPPRTTFPSSRNVSKLSDFPDKGSGDAEEQDAPRSRFFPDKSNRKSMNEKEGRDNRESWTNARERRQLGGDDEHRSDGRYGRRDRDQDGERRNGHGDREWGPRDSRRQNGERQGGWRDRERDRRDRDWDRGAPAEKEPEWMDDPSPTGLEDSILPGGMARNQEEFQKWKAAMSGKKVDEVTSPEPAEVAKDTAAPKASLKLEGIVDKPFGGWGDTKPPNALETTAPGTKSAPAKSKGSRFASMFKDQAKDETPSAEAPAPPLPGEAAEDQAGFQRILQMLGGNEANKSMAQEGPSSPPQRSTTNGTMKQKSRFTGFFDQTPKSPERVQSPPEVTDADVFSGSRGMPEDPGSIFGGRLHDQQTHEQTVRGQGPRNPISPEPMFPQNGNRDQQHPPPPQQRMSDLFIDQPPSRGAATPDNSIQNLLAAQRAQRSQGQDKSFLLDLLQTKGSRPTSQQARPENNFPLWIDQPPNMPEPHAPKPRAPPPPGLFEDQLLRNTPQEPPAPRQEQQQVPGNDLPHRRPSQRAPPGFYDEQSLFLQQQQQQQQAAAQRRNFTEPNPQQQQGRRMSGHPNLPQMQIPQHHQQYPGPPPEFLASPGAHQQGPPPGFNPHMPRHPPGFQNIPNIFHAPQQGREPPGFQGGMPGTAGGMQSPPNAPPGFFSGPQGMPPGFMGVRSPTEVVGSGIVNHPGGRGARFEGFDGQMGVPRR